MLKFLSRVKVLVTFQGCCHVSRLLSRVKVVVTCEGCRLLPIA